MPIMSSPGRNPLFQLGFDESDSFFASLISWIADFVSSATVCNSRYFERLASIIVFKTACAGFPCPYRS
jgi:hypothetical protein